MGNLHTIKALLYDNALTENPNDFVARVSSERSLGVKDICRSAVSRGGATVSADAMEIAVNQFHKEMVYNLCDGFGINTEWYTVAVSIKGVFDSPIEKFNPSKHTVAFDFQQGARLRKELSSVDVQILGAADIMLNIAQVTDVKTGSVNDLLTPNRNLRISGSRIRIAGDNAANGVYFVNQATQERIKVDSTDMVTNNPSELIIVIPALAPGEWKVEATTQFGGNTKQLLKEPRTAVFERVLTVS
jgi:hypothetical protein